MKLKLLLIGFLAIHQVQVFSQSEKQLLKQIKQVAATVLPESPWSQYPTQDFRYEFDNEKILITYDDKTETVLSKIHWKDIVEIKIGDAASGPEVSNYIKLNGKTFVKFENTDWQLQEFNSSYYSSLRMGYVYDRKAANKLVELLKKMARKKGALLK